MRARIRPVARLDPATREAMWTLYHRYYEADRAGFERDLDEKRDVILVRDGGRLVGFSTLTWWHDEHDGRRFVALFSGDTVVDQDHWGHAALQRAFGRYMLRLRLRHRRVYWFLISKGYKTYLLLARNFPEHWPRRDAPTPPWEAGAIDRLAGRRFAAAWQPGEGVVRGSSDSPRLREGVAPVGARESTQPEVAFFVAANPGHQAGDELACLGRIDLDLLPRYLLKRLRRTLRAWWPGRPDPTPAVERTQGHPEPART